MRRPLVLVVPLLCLLLAAAPSRAAGPQLGPLLRVTTPGSAVCPAESEPEVAVTSAGTWVGYNDLGGCAALPTQRTSFTTVQLLPRGGGAARVVQLPELPVGDHYAGDPELAADGATGGIVLATLRLVSDVPAETPGVNVGGLRLEVFRIAPDLRVTALPHPDSDGADKEFLAVDPRDRTIHLVWDDSYNVRTVLQSFRGGRWSPVVPLHDAMGTPDVAVGRGGQVAVAFETKDGVAVRTSRDGRTFTAPVTVMRGSGPGRTDPSCPLRPTVGDRQRAIKSPRVAYDRDDRLHVVAALGGASLPETAGGLTDGLPASVQSEGAVFLTSSKDGRAFTPQRRVSPVEGPVQWNPALAPSPAGGVAVSFLQTVAGAPSSYDARLVVVSPGGTLSGPTVLSSAAGPLLPAQEAFGNANCYGIGDYTGLAPTATGVVAAWPTTVGVARSVGDSDIAVRAVDLR